MIVSITDAVNSHLVAKAKKNDRDYSYFHASSWDRCKRKIAYEYYEAKGVIKIDPSCIKIDPQGERIFDNGHSMHDRWKRYLQATGSLLGKWICRGCEKPTIYGNEHKWGCYEPDKCSVCSGHNFDYSEVGFVDKETMWGGHVDAIVDQEKLAKFSNLKAKFTPEEKFIIVDFKTMNPMDFKKLEAPKPEHITQMHIYMYGLGFQFGKFIYEDKGWQAIKEFVIKRDESLLQIKKAECSQLRQVVTLSPGGQRRLPARGYSSKMATDCIRCKYRGHCWDQRHDQRRKDSKKNGHTPPQSDYGIEDVDV